VVARAVRVTAAVAVAILACFVGGCGGNGASDQAGWVEKGSGKSSLDVGPRAADSPVNEELAAVGEKLFKSKTCSTCHAFGARITGPDLVGVTRRRAATWIEAQIQRPDVMLREDPISRELLGEYAVPMPNLGIKPEEAKALVEFMKKKDRPGV
jgi:mono/diheme cytochrome c family protein